MLECIHQLESGSVYI